VEPSKRVREVRIPEKTFLSSLLGINSSAHS
jgi:hypothetical protein